MWRSNQYNRYDVSDMFFNGGETTVTMTSNIFLIMRIGVTAWLMANGSNRYHVNVLCGNVI